MYDFACEHCSGTVRERRVDREALRHKGSFVVLENVPVGVCDRCGARYSTPRFCGASPRSAAARPRPYARLRFPSPPMRRLDVLLRLGKKSTDAYHRKTIRESSTPERLFGDVVEALPSPHL